MRQSFILTLLAGGGILFCSGCWRPMGAPYGYGMQGYPGYYNSPATGAPGSGFQTLTPGGQYVPNVPIPENGSPGGASGPTPTYGNGNSGGNASPYYGENRAVPDPIDGTYNPQPNEQYRMPNTTYVPPENNGGFSALKPMPEGPALEPVPTPVVQASFIEKPSQDLPESQAGYDRENLSWVQGVLRYDAQQKTWSIIYDETPDASDPYPGRFTLAMTPALDGLSDGQHVRLTGQIDPVQRDQHGKATYLAKQVEKID